MLVVDVGFGCVILLSVVEVPALAATHQGVEAKIPHATVMVHSPPFVFAIEEIQFEESCVVTAQAVLDDIVIFAEKKARPLPAAAAAIPDWESASDLCGQIYARCRVDARCRMDDPRTRRSLDDLPARS